MPGIDIRTRSLPDHRDAAPGPGEREFTRSHWPHVRKTALCGAGVRIIDRQWLRCFDCIHWVWPLPAGHTGGRQHKSKEWWDGAGLCTAHAPRPGTEEGERAYWRVTHETEDGCGDGEPKDQADQAAEAGDTVLLIAGSP